MKLRKVLSDNNIFNDPKMKLLIFTEHKDTLDYLAGDGKNQRPLGKLRQWNLNTTQIHGGMKIGDRDTPGTRIYAEREFRDDAQVLVATEAAGEGINLQFCWFMVNYDIPWNPSGDTLQEQHAAARATKHAIGARIGRSGRSHWFSARPSGQQSQKCVLFVGLFRVTSFFMADVGLERPQGAPVPMAT